MKLLLPILFIALILSSCQKQKHEDSSSQSKEVINTTTKKKVSPRRVTIYRYGNFPSSFCRQVLKLLRQIYDAIQRLSFDGPSAARIYDNKAAMALLGIKDKYLKNLRDNGSLGYSRHGDKYWYTQADIDRFLSRFHFDPFTDKYRPK